jgi:hypothetical protein
MLELLVPLARMMIVKKGTPGSPVVPPVSLGEANLHLTTLLHLLETITVTELPTNDATFLFLFDSRDIAIHPQGICGLGNTRPGPRPQKKPNSLGGALCANLGV